MAHMLKMRWILENLWHHQGEKVDFLVRNYAIFQRNDFPFTRERDSLHKYVNWATCVHLLKNSNRCNDNFKKLWLHQICYLCKNGHKCISIDFIWNFSYWIVCGYVLLHPDTIACWCLPFHDVSLPVFLEILTF